MSLHRFDTLSEQGVLRISIAITLFVTVLGVVFGLLAESLTLLFDAIYELIDVVMTGLALLVARLIATSTSGAGPGPGLDRRLARRFDMGFWHLEPIVLGMNGLLLMAAAFYGLLHSIDSVMNGGRQLDFGYAILFAVISLIVELGAAAFLVSANRRIRSEFLALDAKSWLMSAGITVAYLLAFGFGKFAEGTRLAWLVPYIDPVALGLVCLAVLPLPFGTVRRAVQDILLLAPADLKQHVDEVARASVQRYGFASHRACVARVGRGRQIELYFLVSNERSARELAEWDRIRDEISDAIGGDTPDRWLMIVFTTDPEWAE
ncbi:MAG TPA: cation transporter [Burkholderiaceae bacterium]|nr:cation transporter [Burkholderiaceae bacterium]